MKKLILILSPLFLTCFLAIGLNTTFAANCCTITQPGPPPVTSQFDVDYYVCAFGGGYQSGATVWSWSAEACPTGGGGCRRISGTPYACTSFPNSCGMRNSGTQYEYYDTCAPDDYYTTDCTASVPSEAACTPMTVTTNAATVVGANGSTMSFTVGTWTTSVAGQIHVYQSDGTTDVGYYPTTNPGSTVNANGTYSATVSSLSCGTTYQFRGEAGTTYGSKLSFTTTACPTMTVAWTNMPQTVNYGRSTRMIYSVNNILAGQTATCDLYDYTGNTEIAGVSPQANPADGVNSFYINPSPTTLPVSPSGYGYIVKCTAPSISAQSSVGNITITTDGSPTASLTPQIDGTLAYSCPAGATGIRLRSTGGYTQSLSGGQYAYANATTPQTQADYYISRMRNDFQQNGVSGQTPLTQLNSFYDRNDSGTINTSDYLWIGTRLVNIPISTASYHYQSGSYPWGVAVDAVGNVYFSNWGASSVLVKNPNTGVVTTFATGISGPTGMAFDKQGNLYVASWNSTAVYKVTPAGVVSLYASNIPSPISVAIDSWGNLYVGNISVDTVTKVLTNGTSYVFATGISRPVGIAVDTDDNVYVAAQFSNTVHKITPGGTVSTYATITDPAGLTIDTTGNLFAGGWSTGNVSKISTSGVVSAVTSGIPTLSSLAIDAAGVLYIGSWTDTVYRATGILDSYPQSLAGGITPLIQNATYTLECYGAYGTVPATASFTAPNLEVKYPSSMSLYPEVTPQCSSDSTSYAVSRSPSWASAGSADPSWASGVTTGTALSDTSASPGAATTTYAYTLRCLKSNGATYTGLITNSINVPPAVVVTNLNTPAVAVGTPALVTWKSDGNSCDLKDYAGALWVSSLTGTPVSGGYNYSYSMIPSDTNFTWLNSSHLGDNAIGWKVTCRDTGSAARLSTTKSSSVQVYNPTTAVITPPDVNNNLRFTCSPDFDYMDIKRNGTSIADYPKTWGTNQISAYSTLIANQGGTYELVCRGEAIDTAVYLTNGIQLYGSIAGNGGVMTTANVTGTTAQTTSLSSDGNFIDLSYDIANATTWTVQYYNVSSGGSPLYTCTNTGAGCTSPYAMYRLTGGTSGVKLTSSVGVPDTPLTSGARWVITASDGTTNKTLTLILGNNTVPSGSILVTPDSSSGVDAYKLYISCYNSLSYNLYNTSFSSNPNRDLVTYGSLTSGGTMTSIVVYTAINSSALANTAPVRLECVGASQTWSDERPIPINSRTPPTVNSFSVYPPTVVCGGGNVALSYKINNPIGKNCKLVADTARALNKYTSADQTKVTNSIATVKSKLNSGGITVRIGSNESGMSTTTAFTRVDANNDTTGEMPRIPIQYPTEFKLLCTNLGVETVVARTQALTACQGEQ